MKPFYPVVGVLVLACAFSACTATPTTAVAREPAIGNGRGGGGRTNSASAGNKEGAPDRELFSFSLLPKSIQPNPELDMTVFTEMTPEGRKLTPPSVQNPVYYVAQPDGFKQLGRSVAGEHAPPLAHIDFFVRKSLATQHYRSARAAEKRPTLLILYRWGTHNAADASSSSDFLGVANADVLQRARLVGGKALVAEIAHTQRGEFAELADMHYKKQYLKAQAADSCYFVILFAYDFEAAVRGQKILYWRTNMTVGSRGVSLRETLRPLIASAGPFLGKETVETQITSRRLLRSEKVEIGSAVVTEYLEATKELPDASSEKEKKNDSLKITP